MSDQTSSDPTTFARPPLDRSAGRTAPVLLALLMATMILPVSIEIAGTRLTPLRILLLICIVPLLLKLMSGRPLRAVATDLLLSFFCVWIVVSFLVVEGGHRFAFAMMSSIEIMAGYLLGRYLIRNIVDFRYLIVLHLAAMAIMFPFALVEFLTGRQIWSEILSVVGDVPWRVESSRPRMGFDRVLAGFDHPILFGVFCSAVFAFMIYGWKVRTGRTMAGLGFVTFMTFMSLSSGAILSILLQTSLVAWNWLTKGSWKLLAGLFGALYLFLELASNRGPLVLFIETMTFSSHNAWTRVSQWEYAGAEALRSPIFGNALTEWLRPSWLGGSLDSYWLVIVYRHGFPAIIALGLAILLIVVRMIRVRDLPADVARLRTGYLFVLMGLCFSMATVHLWDATAVYFYFLLGAGIWITEAGGTADQSGEATDTPAAPQPSRYSRFAPGPPRTARDAVTPDARQRPARAS